MPLSTFAEGCRALWRPFARDRLLHALLLFLPLLWWQAPPPARALRGAVDWPTLATLSGLLLLTQCVQQSGYLDHLGRQILNRLRHERALALFLISAAAALSTVLTNDVALFVVVPLTLGLAGVPGLPVGRLVIFEALAVNAGSLLTPIGNPQNILLWQKSGLSFAAFTLQMAPLALGCFAALLIAACFAFPDQRIAPHVSGQAGGYHGGLLARALALYGLFLLTVDSGHAGAGLLGLALVLLLTRRAVLLAVDWSLIAVFLLMFVDIHLLASLPLLREALAALPASGPAGLYLAGLLGSQVISNVPATMLLVDRAGDLRLLAYAVNAGGFGFALGSLANLIALRMAAEPGLTRRFHYWSLPALALAGFAGWWLAQLTT
ncbi:SLC13 family permease [uncultured Aquitalea sp.]|uniref:SLC13 family permease n=1 Tax=uncultured Aquitalea sp. TaxID=540272 RepID=UPI0025FACE01|nr:SLC13 family permease [uncultured Aquitalea sp.]